MGDAVEVRYGSELLKDQPSVVSTKLGRGTQAVAIGRQYPAQDGMWLPIEPPPGEAPSSRPFRRGDTLCRKPGTPAPVSRRPPPRPTLVLPRPSWWF